MRATWTRLTFFDEWRNVEFHLHESFERPVRVVSQSPFQVTETGWGEFEVKIVVNFVDPEEDPVVFLHLLRLHPVDGKPPNIRIPVVSEVQESVIFERPRWGPPSLPLSLFIF